MTLPAFLNGRLSVPAIASPLFIVSNPDLGANDQLAEELVEAYLDPNVCSYYRDSQDTDISHCGD